MQFYLKNGPIEGLGDVGITIPLGVAGGNDVSMKILLMAQLADLLPSRRKRAVVDGGQHAYLIY